MEALLILLAIAYLALPVVTFLMALQQRRKLADLERALLRTGYDLSEPNRIPPDQMPTAAPDATVGKAPETAVEKPADTFDESPDQPASPDAQPARLETEDTGGSAGDIPQQPEARKRTDDLENRIGGRWSVILGGITIAVGTILLVRYTIEAGLIGPKVRIALGFLLSALLFAGGEYLRRMDRRFDLPVFPLADIPGILTGAGSIGAFATLYAAYGYYGFVGPVTSFAGLTIIGLATMLLSVVHGPALAAIGALGSYVTPLLVSTDAPNPVALAFHVIIVSASVGAMARLRAWSWLALCAVAGGAFWTVMEATIDNPMTGVAAAILLIGLGLIFAATFVWDLAERPDPLEDRPAERLAILAFAVLALIFMLQAGINTWLEPSWTGLALALIPMAVAWIYPAAALLAIVSAIIAILGAIATDLPLVDLPGMIQTDQIRRGLVPPDIQAFLLKVALIAVPPGLLALHGAQRAGPTAPRMAGYLAWAASSLAFFATLTAYLRVSPFETRPAFGIAALLLAGFFAYLVERFSRLRPDDDKAPAPAAFAVASVALLSFAIGVSLSKEWMPLLFSLVSLGIAFIYTRRPVSILPWLAVASGVLGAFALWVSSPFPAGEIGTTPFLNYLIVLAALPATALISAGEILRRVAREPEASIIIAFGLAALGLFVGLELRHWLHDGNIAAPYVTLADIAAQTIAALSFAIGLQLLTRRAGPGVYDKASVVAGAIGILFIATGLIGDNNPLVMHIPVGEKPIANLLLPSYLVPAFLCGVVAWLARPVRPRWYTLAYAALCGVLLFIFASATTRHAYHGSYIDIFMGASDFEVWTYSAVWLSLGALVLAAGIYLRSRPIRAASGILIALTICKVFLIDMESLTGALRAFSFIGLGLSLLAIGWFYQRIFMRPTSAVPVRHDEPPDGDQNGPPSD